MRSVASIAICALLIAAAEGCGGYVKPRPVLEPRAQTFLEARAEPPPASTASEPGAPPPSQTIELIGAVARPGTVTIEDSLRTFGQALEAVGGPIGAANTLRIRPANDVVSKLFAENAGGETSIEIPLVAALAEKP